MAGIDPGLGVPIIAVALGGIGYAWVVWSDRRFIRKYGPDPSDVPAPPPASCGEGRPGGV